jgi:phosphate transport system substrate-binding protein
MLLAVLFWINTSSWALGQVITGSGSTFAFPVMAEWARTYQRTTGISVEYQPVGSTAGLVNLQSSIADFAVSDAPLAGSQLLDERLSQFPLVIGAIVPIVNLDGIGPAQLHLTGQTLADIYLGKIKNWNDPALLQLNPNLALPNKPIVVVYRSDGSGTTYNWTDYLSKVSSEWRAVIGSGLLVQWQTGFSAKGSGGVAEKVLHVKGAIGYVELSYALQSRMSYALIRNRAGNYVVPSDQSFRAAIAAVDWSREPDFHVLLTDPPASDAYPIMATSFVLVRRHPSDMQRAYKTRAFFLWALSSGRGIATSLNYLPLPPDLLKQIETAWLVPRLQTD